MRRQQAKTHRCPGRLIAAFLALALNAHLAMAATLLQYGFDHTNGTVKANGGTVADDSGGNHTAVILAGDGGTYVTDRPPADKVKNSTGIGSLDLSSGSLITRNGAGLPAIADIIQQGGLTLEVWAKGGDLSGLVLGYDGVYVIQSTEQGFEFANGFDEFVQKAEAAVDRTQWHHLAGVLSNPRMSGSDLVGDLNLYVDGKLVATYAGAHFLEVSDASATVGNHPLFAQGLDLPFTGLVYEPRMSLGSLSPDQFTVVSSTPASGLTISLVNGQVVVRWQGTGVLQTAPKPTGPYSPVTTTGNSYAVQPGATPAFFRIAP